MPLPTAITVYKRITEACFDGMCLLNPDHMQDRNDHLFEVLSNLGNEAAMAKMAAREVILLARAFSFCDNSELRLYMGSVVDALSHSDDVAQSDDTVETMEKPRTAPCVNERCDQYLETEPLNCGRFVGGIDVRCDGCDKYVAADIYCVNKSCEFFNPLFENNCSGVDDVTGDPGIVSCDKYDKGS